MSGAGASPARSPGSRRHRRERRPARRHAQGEGRVRVLVRPVGRRNAVGDHPAQPASVRADPLGRLRRGARAARACTPSRRTRTCPGRKTYGLELPDQPVLAIDLVRYQGEPVAIVAADHPETARRAAELIEVDYEPLDPLVDMDLAVGGRRAAAARGRERAQARARAATATSRPREPRAPSSSWRASTSSACRTRPSSARSPGSRSRARTAASTSTSPPSGCTSISQPGRRQPRPGARAGADHERRVWAAPSAGARTSRCRSTAACSPSTPGAR